MTKFAIIIAMIEIRNNHLIHSGRFSKMSFAFLYLIFIFRGNGWFVRNRWIVLGHGGIFELWLGRSVGNVGELARCFVWLEIGLWLLCASRSRDHSFGLEGLVFLILLRAYHKNSVCLLERCLGRCMRIHSSLVGSFWGFVGWWFFVMVLESWCAVIGCFLRFCHL